MSWYPTSYIVPQYEDSSGNPYSGSVLKFYAAGTTTVLALATDYTGAVQLTSIALNSNGNPAYLGSVVIPHVTRDYKIALYPSQAAADSNTGALWVYDNVKVTSGATAGSIVSVASAAVVDLNSNVTDYFLITGTTTITGITLADGAEVTVRFADILTVTNGAFLVNIGGVDILTKVGDIAVFRGEAAGVVRMLAYTGATGTAGLVPIKKVTVSSPVSSVDFVNGSGGVVLDSTYKNYKVVMDVKVGSDDVGLYMRTSSDAGVSFDSGASDYAYSIDGSNQAGSQLAAGAASAAQIGLSIANLGNSTGERYCSEVTLFDPSSAAYFYVLWTNTHVDKDGVVNQSCGSGVRKSAADVNGFRITPSSGNIAAGTVITLYGLKGE